MTEPEPTYTATELAALLKQHPATVQRKARAGKYPHTKLGGQYRFTAAHYEQIITAGQPVEDTRQARKELRKKLNRRTA